MRSVLILAFLVLAGCAGIRFGDPDVIRANEILDELNDEAGTYNEMSLYGDHGTSTGLLTAAAFIEWDGNLTRIEALREELNQYMSVADEPILAYRDSLGVWLRGQRLQLRLVRHCTLDAPAPHACMAEIFLEHTDRWLQETGDLNDAMIRAAK